MPASKNMPHADLAEGYKVGSKLIRGISVATPVASAGRAAPGDTRRFLLGIRQGIKDAGGKLS